MFDSVELNTPVGQFAQEKAKASFDFATVGWYTSLATEDLFDYDTEAGDLMIID